VARAGGHRRGGRLGAVALVLAVLLFLLSGVQAVLLYRLNHALDQANRTAAADRRTAAGRADALEARIKDLERRAGKNLDAQAVAAEVLPSVFRVIAGGRSGTAFAIGKDAEGGGTNLLTNFHVVEPVYTAGGRDVALERTNARYAAKIVRVDQHNDLALLHTDEKFPKLVAETEEPKAGQPVILVGAPYGLEDTVTTGAVSAIRDTPEGRLLQFDAPINPGNSGGPVVNAQHRVVGIAVGKISSAEGLGLAIPIGVACQAFSIC
jgi:S1-C subfamily serine protease